MPVSFAAYLITSFRSWADVEKVLELKKIKKTSGAPGCPRGPPAARQAAAARGASPSSEARCKAPLRSRVPATRPPSPDSAAPRRCSAQRGHGAAPAPGRYSSPLRAPLYLHTQRRLVNVFTCVSSGVKGSPANDSPGAVPLAVCRGVNQMEFACRARRGGAGGSAGPPWETQQRLPVTRSHCT